MEFKIPVTKDNIYRGVLTVLNFQLKLSELELDMLSVMLKNGVTTVDINTRELIRKVMNRDKFSTNNYIKRLKDKKVILQEDTNKRLYVNPSIISLVKNEIITFKFIKDERD